MSNARSSIPYFRLAWRNTWRHSRRTVLTASAVLVAVMMLTFSRAYITGIIGNMADSFARTEAGHVRVRKAGYTARERSMPMHLNLPNVTELSARIRELPAVTTVLPRIRTSVLVDGAASNRPGLLIGIDMASEEGYLSPSALLVEGRLPRAGAAEALAGRGFAEKLEVTVGDTLTLLGQTAYRSLGGLSVVITGLGATGMGYLDNVLLLTPIDQVQLLADLPDATTELLVFANSIEEADTLATAVFESVGPLVPGGIESVSWKDQGSLGSLLEMSESVYGVMLFILVLMAGLIIVNTMLMTVMERTREFGMLAAMGMRRSNIVMMIVAEGLVIGVIGALVGGILGSAVTIWLEINGIDMTAAMSDIEFPLQGILYPDWTVSGTMLSMGIGFVAAGLATLYPALRAVRLAPAEALRA